jgi:hypothetical protein
MNREKNPKINSYTNPSRNKKKKPQTSNWRWLRVGLSRRLQSQGLRRRLFRVLDHVAGGILETTSEVVYVEGVIQEADIKGQSDKGLYSKFGLVVRQRRE